jgi:hypothetical protein
MRRILPALLVVLLATAASAQEWTFEDLDIPIAYFDNGDAQFQFACRGGDLTMGFWVRAPHQQVAGSTAMNLAITPDPAVGDSGVASDGTSFAQDIPLIHSDGSSMIIRGPVARQWARIAQRAKSSIRVAYVRRQDGLEVFDAHDFSAKGSAASIKQVLDRCG